MAVSVGFHFSRFGQFQMRWPCAAPSVASDGNERCRDLVLAPTVSPQLWQISLSLRVPFSIASSRSWRNHGGSERQQLSGYRAEERAVTCCCLWRFLSSSTGTSSARTRSARAAQRRQSAAPLIYTRMSDAPAAISSRSSSGAVMWTCNSSFCARHAQVQNAVLQKHPGRLPPRSDLACRRGVRAFRLSRNPYRGSPPGSRSPAPAASACSLVDR